MTLFLLLLLFFVIWPLVKGMLAIMRARRSARRFFDQFRQAAGASAGSSQPQKPEPPRKKINPEDGEFVAFEDLPADSESTTHTETYTEIRVEQQIVDVEWEDIK